MIIEPFHLYLILQLDTIKEVLSAPLIILGLISGLGMIIFAIASCCSEAFETWKGRLLGLLSSFGFALIILLLGVVYSLIPSTRTALTVFGVPAILESQQEAINSLEKTPKKVVDLLNKYLDETLEEKKEDKSNGK